MRATHFINSAAALVLAVAIGSHPAVAQDRGHDRDQQQGRDHDKDSDRRKVSDREQQERIDEQRRRDEEYRPTLDRQLRAAEEHRQQLQAQSRAAQIEAHQQYLANLREQQEHLRAERDYRRDPYYSAPVQYRYRLGGMERETNEYGAQTLRQAVNVGYQQGYQAGRADRQDHWAANYERSYAYQDANYGYNGTYVPRSDYNYYFREGFRRGYMDGFDARQQYGIVSNGSPSILANILAGILPLAPIR